LLIGDTAAFNDRLREAPGSCATHRAAASSDDDALFGADLAGAMPRFEMNVACGEADGIAQLQSASNAGLPYAVAFIDTCLSATRSGIHIAERLWQVDPRLQVVLCTSNAEASLDDTDTLTSRNGWDRLLILKKPFSGIEARQLACVLSAKWSALERDGRHDDRLEKAVQERTGMLVAANAALRAEIDERKRVESQIVLSQKLASIGQLAAGVAHEINNPIGYVFSNFNTLGGYLDGLFEVLAAYEAVPGSGAGVDAAVRLREVKERADMAFLRDDVPALMQESKEGIERVRRIVQSLKDFSRVDDAPTWQFASLHEGIDAILSLIGNEIRVQADVVKRYANLPHVECVASEINQVVMNLVVNAAQAMGSRRGTIVVSTGHSDDTVWLEVDDNGSGIAPDVLPRIFDPFFTTKPVGQGCGLGLAQSYGIVQKHGGRIDVYSELGRGTTFRVSLPLRQPAPDAAGPAQEGVDAMLSDGRPHVRHGVPPATSALSRSLLRRTEQSPPH